MRYSELQVKITSNIAGLTQGLREASADLAKTANQVNRQTIGFKQFGASLSDIGSRMTLGVTAPLVGLAGAALKAAGSMEVTATSFRTMLGSTEAARQKLEELKQFAASTPFQFTELADATRRMLALGFAAKDIVPTLRVVGNATSALGTGSEGLNRIILALGQIRAKGAVQAEEMRQLAEAGIPAWDALATRLGVTVPEAMKLVEKRAVSAQVAIDAVMSAMEARFGGGMEAQAKTLVGLWSNVKDSISFALADIGQAMLPLAKSFASDFVMPAISGIRNLASAFSELPMPVQSATVAVAGLLAVAGPGVWAFGQLTTSLVSLTQAARLVAPVLSGVPALVSRLATVLASNLEPATNVVTVTFASGAAAIAAWGAVLAGIIASIGYFVRASAQLRSATNESERASKSLETTLGTLLVKLHQAGVDTAQLDMQYRSGQISVEAYVSALLKMVNAHVEAQKAIPGTAAAVSALGDAFKKLGIASGEELTKNLNEARAALAVIKKAYADGSASADDVARAQDVVQKAFDALHPSIAKASSEYEKWLQKFPKGKVLSDEAANSWAILQAKIGMVVDRKQELIQSIAKLQVAQESELEVISALNEQYGIFSGMKSLPIIEPKISIPQVPVQDLKLPTLPKVPGQVFPTFPSVDEARQYEVEFAKIEQAYESGILTSREYESELERLARRFPEASRGATEMGNSGARASRQMSESMRQISTIMTDLSRGIADSIVEWKGLGEVGKKIAKDLASAIIRDVVEGAFKKLSGAITGSFSQLSSLGSAISKLFGGGASAAGAAGSAVGSAGSAAGSIGSAVGSSITGIVGAVAGVASAISGIVGNFQMAGMNKSLDLIVKHTLQAANQLIYGIQPQINAYLPALQGIHERLMELRTAGIGVFPQPGYEWALAGAGAGGGNSFTFEIGNVYGGPAGLDALTDEIIRRLIQRGLKF